jgi:hypothetical protein
MTFKGNSQELSCRNLTTMAITNKMQI